MALCLVCTQEIGNAKICPMCNNDQEKVAAMTEGEAPKEEKKKKK